MFTLRSNLIYLKRFGSKNFSVRRDCIKVQKNIKPLFFQSPEYLIAYTDEKLIKLRIPYLVAIGE